MQAHLRQSADTLGRIPLCEDETGMRMHGELQRVCQVDLGSPIRFDRGAVMNAATHGSHAPQVASRDRLRDEAQP